MHAALSLHLRTQERYAKVIGPASWGRRLVWKVKKHPNCGIQNGSKPNSCNLLIKDLVKLQSTSSKLGIKTFEYFEYDGQGGLGPSEGCRQEHTLVQGSISTEIVPAPTFYYAEARSDTDSQFIYVCLPFGGNVNHGSQEMNLSVLLLSATPTVRKICNQIWLNMNCHSCHEVLDSSWSSHAQTSLTSFQLRLSGQNYHQQYDAKPNARGYCGLRPLGVELDISGLEERSVFLTVWQGADQRWNNYTVLI